MLTLKLFFKPTPIFSDAEMTVVGNSIFRCFKIVFEIDGKSINHENLSVC